MTCPNCNHRGEPIIVHIDFGIEEVVNYLETLLDGPQQNYQGVLRQISNIIYDHVGIHDEFEHDTEFRDVPILNSQIRIDRRGLLVSRIDHDENETMEEENNGTENILETIEISDDEC